MILVASLFACLAASPIREVSVTLPLGIYSVQEILTKAYPEGIAIAPELRDRCVLAQMTEADVSKVVHGLEQACDGRLVEEAGKRTFVADPEIVKRDKAWQTAIANDLRLQVSQRKAAFFRSRTHRADYYTELPANPTLQYVQERSSGALATGLDVLATLTLYDDQALIDSMKNQFAMGRSFKSLDPRNANPVGVKEYLEESKAVGVDFDEQAIRELIYGLSLSISPDRIVSQYTMRLMRTRNSPTIFPETWTASIPVRTYKGKTNPTLFQVLTKGYSETPLFGGMQPLPEDGQHWLASTVEMSKAFAELPQVSLPLDKFRRRLDDALSQVIERWASASKADMMMALDPPFESLAKILNFSRDSSSLAGLFKDPNFGWYAKVTDGVAVIKNKLSFLTSGRAFPSLGALAAERAGQTNDGMPLWIDGPPPEKILKAFVTHSDGLKLWTIPLGDVTQYRGVNLAALVEAAPMYRVWLSLPRTMTDKIRTSKRYDFPMSAISATEKANLYGTLASSSIHPEFSSSAVKNAFSELILIGQAVEPNTIRIGFSGSNGNVLAVAGKNECNFIPDK